MDGTRPWHPKGHSISLESPALLVVSCMMSVPHFWDCLAPRGIGAHDHCFRGREREAVGQHTSGASLVWLSQLSPLMGGAVVCPF